MVFRKPFVKLTDLLQIVENTGRVEPGSGEIVLVARPFVAGHAVFEEFELWDYFCADTPRKMLPRHGIESSVVTFSERVMGETRFGSSLYILDHAETTYNKETCGRNFCSKLPYGSAFICEGLRPAARKTANSEPTGVPTHTNPRHNRYPAPPVWET